MPRVVTVQGYESPSDYGQLTTMGVEDYVCDLTIILRNRERCTSPTSRGCRRRRGRAVT
jgi:hypothetical protein